MTVISKQCAMLRTLTPNAYSQRKCALPYGRGYCLAQLPLP